MSSILSPIKSENDKKLYRVIELPNGLRALLVSDPISPEELSAQATGSRESDSGHVSAEEVSDSEEQSEDEAVAEGDDEEDKGPKEKMAAAALCVNVGSFSDPNELQGLAHYLEHMLFMGSEKYPDENGYSAFMKKRSGSENAFTDSERTVYKLEIHPKHFHEALDMLAQFFIAPLMKKGSMDRELEAVDSEFNLALPHDNSRKMLLLGSLSKEGSPTKAFGWGNTETLKIQPEANGVDVYSRLREFWKRYYSAQFMTLAVQSTETLDILEQWVREHYSAIPNNQLPLPSFEEHKDPFNTPEFYRFYKLCPVKKTHCVFLHWALPSQQKNYKCKPLHYLGHLVGHEGKGSLLALLRKRAWALSLYSGNDESGTDQTTIYSSFTFKAVLTDTGMDHLYDVLTLVFQYLKLLRSSGPQKWIFDELKMIEENQFRFQEETEAQDYVEELCQHMQLFPPEHYLTGYSQYFEYDPDIIDSCTQALTPETANLMVMSTRYLGEESCNNKEKWTKMNYSVEDIPTEWIEAWKNISLHPELHLPLPNPYIATDFEIKPALNENIEYPVKIFENENCRMFFKKDHKFNVPKASIYFHLLTPQTGSTAENEVLSDLMLEVLDQHLSTEVYTARMASLSYHIFKNETGFIIKLDGLGHKLPKLLETILEHFLNFDVEPEVFDGIKKQQMKVYYNNFNSPGNLNRDTRLSLISNLHWTAVEKRAILPNVTLPMLVTYSKQILNMLFVEGLAQGNLFPQEAIDLVQLVCSKLKCSTLPPSMIPKIQVAEIPIGAFALRVATFNREDTNSVVTNYYQGKPGSIHSQTLLELLCECLEEPCFDTLRTKEQLGYSVGVTLRNSYGILGFSVTVQSVADKFCCSHIDSRIECFVQGFLESIASMTQDEFEMQVLSLIRLKQCEDLQLKEEANRNWAEVAEFEYVFDRLQRQVNCLKELTLEQFQSWVTKEILFDRRKLSVQVVGYGQVGKDDCLSFPDLPCNSEELEETPQAFELQFLQPKEPSDKMKYLTDIPSFKQTLQLYPEHRICE